MSVEWYIDREVGIRESVRPLKCLSLQRPAESRQQKIQHFRSSVEIIIEPSGRLVGNTASYLVGRKYKGASDDEVS